MPECPGNWTLSGEHGTGAILVITVIGCVASPYSSPSLTRVHSALRLTKVGTRGPCRPSGIEFSHWSWCARAPSTEKYIGLEG